MAKSICVVTQQYSQVISGIGLHANLLVERLINDGFNVIVIVPKNQIPHTNRLCKFIGVDEPIWGRTQARWFSLARSFANVINNLEDSVDIVHFTDAREAYFIRFKNMPLVGNVNDTYAAEVKSLNYYRRYYSDWVLRWGYYHLVNYCERKTFTLYDALIANSQYTANTIADEYRLDRDKIWICYKAIDLKEYEATREARRNCMDAVYRRVLFVGGNMQRKGLPVLIRAAPWVKKIIPEIEFWIVGEDRNQPKLKELCNRFGVGNAFKFLGWKSRDHLIDIYKQVDMFVMPSLTEAFGVVFLEAMACGVPVIGTRVGGIPEIIIDGYNGVLIDPLDYEHLAKAIIDLIQNESLRKKFFGAGVETASRFSADRMMRCTYSIYDAVQSLGA